MTLTIEEANAREWPTVQVGSIYVFHSEVEWLRHHTGERVLVTGEVAENDTGEPLYHVRAENGDEFQAWVGELNGWDEALGQYVRSEDG